MVASGGQGHEVYPLPAPAGSAGGGTGDVRGGVRRLPSGAASACRWFWRRRPACSTCPTLRLHGVRVASDDAGEGDEGASVLRPGLEDREIEEVDVCAAVDDLLAGGVFGGDDLGEEAAYFGKCWEKQSLSMKLVGVSGFRRVRMRLAMSSSESVSRASCIRRRLPKLVHQDFCARVAFYVFEE